MFDSVTHQQVTAKAREFLSKNEGLFIGESHSDTVAADFIRANRKEFSAEGVTTLYIESSAYFARAGQGGLECRKEFLENKDIAKTTLQTQLEKENELIKAALASGWRVIGHDSVNGSAWMLTQMAKDRRFLSKHAETGEGVDRRDDYAADLIRRTRDGGKYIVFAGSHHSGNDISTRPSGKGLSERLGIHSIDFRNPEFFYARENLGTLQATVSALWDRPQDSPIIRMRNGKDGESDVKVTSWKLRPFVESKLTPEEEKRVAKLAAEARNSGACSPLPADLQQRVFLDTRDTDSLVKRLNEASKPRSP